MYYPNKRGKCHWNRKCVYNSVSEYGNILVESSRMFSFLQGCYNNNSTIMSFSMDENEIHNLKHLKI